MAGDLELAQTILDLHNYRLLGHDNVLTAAPQLATAYMDCRKLAEDRCAEVDKLQYKDETFKKALKPVITLTREVLRRLATGWDGYYELYAKQGYSDAEIISLARHAKAGDGGFVIDWLRPNVILRELDKIEAEFLA